MVSNKAVDKAFFDALGIELKDDFTLKRALSHRSAASGWSGYERLEFQGDRVLGLAVADMLLECYRDENEGQIAKRHAALVQRQTLAEVAVDMGLGDYIFLSEGEDSSGGRDNPAILGDVVESLLAAIYREGGMKAARAFVEKYLGPRMEACSAPPRDPKTSLQEWLQARGRPLPEYNLVDRNGPDHAPVFTVAVIVDGEQPLKADGKSKRAAEQVAASLMLDRLTS